MMNKYLALVAAAIIGLTGCSRQSDRELLLERQVELLSESLRKDPRGLKNYIGNIELSKLTPQQQADVDKFYSGLNGSGIGRQDRRLYGLLGFKPENMSSQEVVYCTTTIRSLRDIPVIRITNKITFEKIKDELINR